MHLKETKQVILLEIYLSRYETSWNQYAERFCISNHSNFYSSQNFNVVAINQSFLQDPTQGKIKAIVLTLIFRQDWDVSFFYYVISS